MFQRATYSEAAAVGTGDYISFGFGGATAQRLADGSVVGADDANFYTFRGDYAAVRITTTSGRSDDVEFIKGDAELGVDIFDFDVTGAVEGTIFNRELFDVEGNSLGLMGNFVSLATAEIDFTNGIIGSSTASGRVGTDELTTGNWQGIFAGPNGEEIAGYVILEGDTVVDGTEDPMRETGVFIVVETGL